MKNKIIEALRKKFKKDYGTEARIFFAPSRINIIGEHIDYNGGRVLPGAIEIGTYAMAKKNLDGQLRLYSINMSSGGGISLEDLSYKKDHGWMNYVAGMVKEIKKDYPDIGGIDAVIYGDIPTGSGLSSSASLEILIGQIYKGLYDLDIPKLKMSIMGMRVENEHMSLKTGIMDQAAISLGRKNSAILLDTASLEYEYVEMNLGDNIFVILNTNKPRELIQSKYNERREETERALAMIQKNLEIDQLAQLSEIEDWEDILGQINDKTLIKRVRHVVEENLRVGSMVRAMEENNYGVMGKLLNQSHISLRDLYEVTGKELDSIVEGAWKSSYTLGARMTGAGFGGCAIALVKKEGLEEFSQEVKEYYQKATGLEAELIISGMDDGPREVKCQY